MKSGIYKITNPKGKVYVGQSINLTRREKEYKRSRGFENQMLLYNSINKYGWNTHIFEIIEECDLNILNTKERYYQDLLNSLNPNGLNLTLTKSIDKSGYVSDIVKEKIRKKAIGRKHSNKTKLKMSNAHKGKKLSVETLLKFSEVKKGKNNYWFGKKLSKKHRLKMSLAAEGNKKLLGYKHTEESKEKIRQSKLGKKRK